MVQLWRSFGSLMPVLVIVVVALAVALPIVVRLSSRRRRLAVGVLLAGWAVCIAAVTLAPVGGQRGRVAELVPGAGITALLSESVSWQVPVAQLGGNVLLFVPLGLLLAVRWAGDRAGVQVGRAAFAGAAAAVVLEVLQFALGFGRVASVDDVLLAVLGTVIGSVLAVAILGVLRVRSESSLMHAPASRSR